MKTCSRCAREVPGTTATCPACAGNAPGRESSATANVTAVSVVVFLIMVVWHYAVASIATPVVAARHAAEGAARPLEAPARPSAALENPSVTRGLRHVQGPPRPALPVNN